MQQIQQCYRASKSTIGERKVFRNQRSFDNNVALLFSFSLSSLSPSVLLLFLRAFTADKSVWIWMRYYFGALFHALNHPFGIEFKQQQRRNNIKEPKSEQKAISESEYELNGIASFFYCLFRCSKLFALVLLSKPLTCISFVRSFGSRWFLSSVTRASNIKRIFWFFFQFDNAIGACHSILWLKVTYTQRKKIILVH